MEKIVKKYQLFLTIIKDNYCSSWFELSDIGERKVESGLTIYLNSDIPDAAMKTTTILLSVHQNFVARHSDVNIRLGTLPTHVRQNVT